MNEEKQWWEQSIDRMLSASGIEGSGIPSPRFWLIPMVNMFLKEAVARRDREILDRVEGMRISKPGTLTPFDFGHEHALDEVAKIINEKPEFL